MLRFSKLIDFINFNKYCPLCKNECSISITNEFASINVQNFKLYNFPNLNSIFYPQSIYPSIFTNFGPPTFSNEEIPETLKDLGFTINLDKDMLKFSATKDHGQKNYLLFEVDLKTSKVNWTDDFNLLNISENYLFNQLNFKLIKFCNYTFCRSYACSSTKIYYGIKNKQIMPFYKKSESIQAETDDKIYVFNTNYNKRKSTLGAKAKSIKANTFRKFYKEYDEIDISKFSSNDSVIDKAEQYLFLS